MKPYFDDGQSVIYHGDCREILPILSTVDLVITDPPFSENAHRNARSNRGTEGARKAINFKSMSLEDIRAVLAQCGALCDRWVIAFLDWRHIASFESSPPDGLELIRFGVWLKSNPMPQLSCDRPANGWDGIAYLHKSNTQKHWSGGGAHGNWYGPVISEGDHPTPKPVKFLQITINRFADLGAVVLDPFMGSGSTLVAAKNLQRKAIGIEINEKYCEVAANRLRQEVLPL